MKYGMNLLLWTSDLTEDQFVLLDQISDWGYDGVELPVFDMNGDKFARIGARLDELGLGRTAVTVCTAEANPVSSDAGIRASALTHLKQAIDMCGACGATHLCGPLHSALGEFTGQGRTQDEWNHARDTLGKAAEYAQSAGVILVVESLNRFECYLLNCAEDTARFCSEIGHPHVKMLYDTFHANIEEKNISDAVRACGDHLAHVHISENDRSTPGEGGVNWDESFAALKEVGYDGWLTIEAFGLALPELAAATRIWRRMYPSEEHLARMGLDFMKTRWES